MKEKMKEKNDVTSFFYYMWNTWSKSECEEIFSGNDANYIWGKWLSYYANNRLFGATEQFFSNLSENFQDMLVKRATETYNRRSKINLKKET
jgi:hypothetical protein